MIRELADRFPDLSMKLLGIASRIVDLLPLTRENYYHPEMRGSWSIKAVLPTIDASLDYANLDDVRHGTQAQQAYAEAIDAATEAEHRARLREGLLAYCKRDTEALVALARFLAQESIR